MTPTIVVLSVVLLVLAVVVFVAAVRSWRLVHGSDRLRRRTASLDAAEQRTHALIQSALARRPAWKVRILVDGQKLPAVACYQVPPGWARDSREAVQYVRAKFPRVATGYAGARWLAFPVTDEASSPQRSVAEPA